MGNALDFLNKQGKTKRRGYHNKECLDKINKHIDDVGTVKCEDSKEVNIGGSGNLRVNERFAYTSNLRGYRSKRMDDREEIECKSCNELFKPTKLRNIATVHQKSLGASEFTIWCSECTRKGTEYRTLLSSVGGKQNYLLLKSKLNHAEDIAKMTSLRELFEEKDVRHKLKMRPIKTLLNRIFYLIDKAYKENEIRSVQNSHYDFDF